MFNKLKKKSVRISPEKNGQQGKVNTTTRGNILWNAHDLSSLRDTRPDNPAAYHTHKIEVCHFLFCLKGIII